MRGNIILFEDEAEVKETIVEILESHDYRVLYSDQNKIDKEELINFSPDLILSDIMMPGKSGYEVFTEIKSVQELQKVPFIFLTAKSDYTDIRIGMNLGADDYLTKPFKVKDLLRSLELRIKKAKKSNEILNGFSSSIALHIPHELRTPLVSIIGYSEIITNEYDSLARDEIINFNTGISTAAKRLHKTIEKFILFSDLITTELNGNKLNRFAEKHRFEIDALIKFAALETAAKHRRTEKINFDLQPFVLDVPDEAVIIIISELLENAFKYSEPETSVEISGQPAGRGYKIEITDRGIGMSNEQLSSLNVFLQFNRGIASQYGNGLGLVIVEKLLTIMNSKLHISSSPSAGTTCSFTLNSN